MGNEGGIIFRDNPNCTLSELQAELKRVVLQLRYGQNMLSAADRTKLDGLSNFELDVVTSVLVRAAAGNNGVGAISFAGAQVGDRVAGVVNLTVPGDAAASFEAVVSVAGQIQQTSVSNLSLQTFTYVVTHEGP